MRCRSVHTQRARNKTATGTFHNLTTIQTNLEQFSQQKKRDSCARQIFIVYITSEIYEIYECDFCYCCSLHKADWPQRKATD